MPNRLILSACIHISRRQQLRLRNALVRDDSSKHLPAKPTHTGYKTNPKQTQRFLEPAADKRGQGRNEALGGLTPTPAAEDGLTNPPSFPPGTLVIHGRLPSDRERM